MTRPDPDTDPRPKSGKTRPGPLARIRTLRKRKGPKAALARLDRIGARLKPGLRRRLRADLLLRLERPAEALDALGEPPAPGKRSHEDRLRLQALIALGQVQAAAALVQDTGFAPRPPDRGLILDLLRAQLDAGAFAGAAASAARLPAQDRGRAPVAPVLTALLLGGPPDRFRAALGQHGESAGTRLLNTARSAAGLLSAARGTAQETAAAQAALRAGIAAALPLLDSPGRAQNLRLALFGQAGDDLDRRIWERAGALERERAPATLEALEVTPAPLPEATAAQLARIARWLDLPADSVPDWIARAHAGQAYQRRLQTLLLHSPPHAAAFAARLESPDWSALRACQEQGQPVLIAAWHHIFVPAAIAQLIRSGLNVRIISGGWRWGPGAAREIPFLTGRFLFHPEGGPSPQLSAGDLRRGLIGQLRAGGCALVAIDGAYGSARPLDLPDHGLRVRLPPPLWSVARKTGAAVVGLETLWQDGRIVTRLTPWEVPPAQPDGRDDALWYDLLIGHARAAALRDPWNIALPSWLVERLV